MLILDPTMYGCTIWNTDTRTIQEVRGSVDAVCSVIWDLLTERGTKMQQHEVLLDTVGIGEAYRELFSRRGIEIFKMQSISPIKV